MPIESVNAQFCQILLAEMVLSINFASERSRYRSHSKIPHFHRKITCRNSEWLGTFAQ